MTAKFNHLTIPPERRMSMQRAFLGDYHKTIASVALHVGVKKEIARAYLKHLIRTKQVPEKNRFLKIQVTKK